MNKEIDGSYEEISSRLFPFMNLIYLYDEFMRVPAGIEGNPVYIFDDTLTEGYSLKDKNH